MRWIGYGWAGMGAWSVLRAFGDPTLADSDISVVIIIAMVLFILPGLAVGAQFDRKRKEDKS